MNDEEYKEALAERHRDLREFPPKRRRRELERTLLHDQADDVLYGLDCWAHVIDCLVGTRYSFPQTHKEAKEIADKLKLAAEGLAACAEELVLLDKLEEHQHKK